MGHATYLAMPIALTGNDPTKTSHRGAGVRPGTFQPAFILRLEVCARLVKLQALSRLPSVALAFCRA